MEKKIVKHLNFAYYGLFVLAVIIASVMLYLIKAKGMTMIDPMSSIGKTIQYIVIFYVIISLPAGLYGFKLICKNLALMEDDMPKYEKYQKFALLRIIVIGLGLSLGVLAFYLLSGYQSMIWCAGISAIGLYFCKPLIGKMEKELTPEDPNAPKY